MKITTQRTPGGAGVAGVAPKSPGPENPASGRPAQDNAGLQPGCSNFNVAGIDASLGGFAMAVSAGSSVGKVFEWKTKPATGVAARIARYDSLVARALGVCREHGVTSAFIEGYSFGSKNRGEHLAELGGILRRELVHAGIAVVEAPPATLKKWATGKGNADKTFVATELARRYGVAFASNNQSDAYALCAMAMQCAGLVVPEVAHQRAVVAKLCETQGRVDPFVRERGDHQRPVPGVPMTIDLDALEALANAASMGPWEWNQRSEHDCSQWGLDGGRGEVVLVADQDVVMVRSPADRDFIATAREAVPELIAEVRRLREELVARCPDCMGERVERWLADDGDGRWDEMASPCRKCRGTGRYEDTDRGRMARRMAEVRELPWAAIGRSLAEELQLMLDRWDREDAEAKK